MRSALVTLAVLAILGCTTSADPGSAAPTTRTDPPSVVPTSTPAEPTEAATAAPVEQSIDVGGRSLFIECTGSGSPTVILEAGLTGDHRTWNRVAPVLDGATRVCSYDRANVGASDPAEGTRTAQDIVDDLHALLAGAGEEPPYVLVGFSFGGLTSQLYASTHPDEIAGLVLVESNHALEAEQFEANLTPEQIEEDRAFVLDNPELVDPYASFEEVQAAGPLPEVPARRGDREDLGGLAAGLGCRALRPTPCRTAGRSRNARA